MHQEKQVAQVKPFLDRDTETWSYVVYDKEGAPPQWWMLCSTLMLPPGEPVARGQKR
ncbi:hypothetical protein P3339_08635 [Microbulbifer sp. MLAF003]|uniref:hypothetical protein n=1 Tax=Microbulbifer sp. MLAF003 TaxID=3032582 RepID=UPI0024AD4527|nr:hypothetical protein [Microbulbifer sp. MLAF003]WHI52812.1 hypothetical protein P3339_08635 [Microbulbifer sp. MLAF003]